MLEALWYYICFLFVLVLFFPGGKKKAQPFPDLEGNEPVADFVSKYKKQCLLRKTQFREMQEKFNNEKPNSGQTLMGAQLYDFSIFSAQKISGQKHLAFPKGGSRANSGKTWKR